MNGSLMTEDIKCLVEGLFGGCVLEDLEWEYIEYLMQEAIFGETPLHLVAY